MIDLLKYECIQKKDIPLVSVIVPCYNVEEYIDQCLNSILDNGYPNIELIVVDDRSTDKTVEHIKEIQKKHPFIQLYHNELDHNIYGGACRNIGLEHAKGKYVYFCDSDDYILPGLFSECVRKCEYFNAQICCFMSSIIDNQNTKPIESHWRFKKMFLVDETCQTFNWKSSKNIFKLTSGVVWDKLYRKDYIDSIGAKFQEIKNSNDMDFHINTFSKAKTIAWTKSVFYVYRNETKTSVQKSMAENEHELKYPIDAIQMSYGHISEVGSNKLDAMFYEWVYEFIFSYIIQKKCNNRPPSWFVRDFIWTMKSIGFFNGKIERDISKFIVKTDLPNSIDDIKCVWNRFDKIVCIHYLPYKERFESIKRELKRVGILDLPQFEWYYTVDNDYYKYILDGMPKEKFGTPNWRKSTDISLSNINYTIDSYSLLKKMEYEGYEHVLVIEDDVSFHNDLNFIKDVVDETPSDYDIMNYDPCVYKPHMGIHTNVSKHIQSYKNSTIFGTAIIAFSKRMIHHIIEEDKKKLMPFDGYTWQNAEQFNLYCATDDGHIGIQNGKYDNMSGKTTNQRYDFCVNGYNLNDIHHPLVSVIVPCYNVEEYIDQCLNSILDNGYSNIEVICIDDRSTDKTVEHITKLMKNHPCIKLIRNETDHQWLGGGSRNVGLDNAKGKYVYFCDSDDYILPELISSCVEKCEKTQSEVCCFKFNQIDIRKNNSITSWHGIRYEYFNSREDVFNINDVPNIFVAFATNPWSKFYRLDFINRIGARLSTIRVSDDVPFHFHVLQMAQRVTYIDEIMYIYRIGVKTSLELSKQNGNNLNDILQSWNETYALLKQYGNQSSIDKFTKFLENELNYLKSRIKYTKDICIQLKEFINDKFPQNKTLKNKIEYMIDLLK